MIPGWGHLVIFLSLISSVTAFTKADSRGQAEEELNPLVSALQAFSELTLEEISAIYALRCAFAATFPYTTRIQRSLS